MQSVKENVYCILVSCERDFLILDKKGYEEQYHLVMFYCTSQANQRKGNQENATASYSANDWQMNENRYRSSIQTNYYQKNADDLQR